MYGVPGRQTALSLFRICGHLPRGPIRKSCGRGTYSSVLFPDRQSGLLWRSATLTMTDMVVGVRFSPSQEISIQYCPLGSGWGQTWAVSVYGVTVASRKGYRLRNKEYD